jgi:hypothetical protein
MTTNSVPAAVARKALDDGRQAFDRGRFFLAHELWEQAWHRLKGPDRAVVQGLIQIAAACHHLDRGRPGPAASLLAKGLAKLAAPPPFHGGTLFPAPFPGPLRSAVGDLLQALRSGDRDAVVAARVARLRV